MAPLLRMRNQFVVTAHTGGGERRHALALYVHIREQDVTYFNSSSDGDGESEGESVSYIEVRETTGERTLVARNLP